MTNTMNTVNKTIAEPNMKSKLNMINEPKTTITLKTTNMMTMFNTTNITAGLKYDG